MSVIVYILSWAFLLGGGFFLLIGAFGMVRFGDFWARLHAASIIDSAGMILILIGLTLHEGFTFITIKIVLIILFLVITAPTASHAIANAAFVSGLRPKNKRTTKNKGAG